VSGPEAGATALTSGAQCPSDLVRRRRGRRRTVPAVTAAASTMNAEIFRLAQIGGEQLEGHEHRLGPVRSDNSIAV